MTATRERIFRSQSDEAGSTAAPRAFSAQCRGCCAALVWAWRGTRAARAMVRTSGLRELAPPGRIPVGPGTARGVRYGLRLARANCLERSLVLRAWHRAQGRDRRIIIGTRGMRDAFVAHAWLEGDHPRDDSGFAELVVWPDTDQTVSGSKFSAM